MATESAEVLIGMLQFSHKHEDVKALKRYRAGLGYVVITRCVEGLTPSSVVKPSDRLKEAVTSAAKDLAALGCVGILGESYLMWSLQDCVAEAVEIPVFMTAMVQIAMLIPAHHHDQKFLLVTKYPRGLQEKLPGILSRHGLKLKEDCLIVVSLKDRELEQPDKLADRLAKERAKDPKIAGAVFDCGELTAHADHLRSRTGMPIFDHVTCLDFFISARSDNPYFGFAAEDGRAITKVFRAAISPFDAFAKEVKARLGTVPTVGVLRIDYSYPTIDGDVADEDSYGYKVVFEQLPGLTFEKAQQAFFDDQIIESFTSAVRNLEAKKVSAITGDCGFLMAYQTFVRGLTEIPVILSSILQAPIIVAANTASDKFALVTANSGTFNKALLLQQCGVFVDPDQFIIVGVQDLESFAPIAVGGEVDPDKARPEMVAALKKLKSETPNLRAVLLECTEMPRYAPALRKELNIPVFDAITMIDYYESSCSSSLGFTQAALKPFADFGAAAKSIVPVKRKSFGAVEAHVRGEPSGGASEAKKGAKCTVM